MNPEISLYCRIFGGKTILFVGTENVLTVSEVFPETFMNKVTKFVAFDEFFARKVIADYSGVRQAVEGRKELNSDADKTRPKLKR